MRSNCAGLKSYQGYHDYLTQSMSYFSDISLYFFNNRKFYYADLTALQTQSIRHTTLAYSALSQITKKFS